MRSIGYVLLTAAWIAGLVLAKGFWSTLLALLIPVWAWYLVAEKAMQMTGLL